MEKGILYRRQYFGLTFYTHEEGKGNGQFYTVNGVYLYEPDGTLHQVRVDCGASIEFPMGGVRFSVRRPVKGQLNFSRGEVFVVRQPRRYSFEMPNTYTLYIPAELVGMVAGETYDEVHDDIITTYRRLRFKVSSFSRVDSPVGGETHYLKLDETVVGADGCTVAWLSVVEYVGMRYTEEYNKRTKLIEQIKNDCGVHLTDYDLRCLLKHYKITRRRKAVEG